MGGSKWFIRDQQFYFTRRKTVLRDNRTETRLSRMEEALSRIEHALGCAPDQMEAAAAFTKKWKEDQEKRVQAVLRERESRGVGDSWTDDDEFRSQMS